MRTHGRKMRVETGAAKGAASMQQSIVYFAALRSAQNNQFAVLRNSERRGRSAARTAFAISRIAKIALDDQRHLSSSTIEER